jgi:hypothetical protein
MIITRIMRWVGYMARKGEEKNACEVLLGDNNVLKKYSAFKRR